METLNLNVKTWHIASESKEFQKQIVKEDRECVEKQGITLELKKAISDGIESGIAENFNTKSYLETLKREYKNVRH